MNSFILNLENLWQDSVAIMLRWFIETYDAEYWIPVLVNVYNSIFERILLFAGIFAVWTVYFFIIRKNSCKIKNIIVLYIIFLFLSGGIIYFLDIRYFVEIFLFNAVFYIFLSFPIKKTNFLLNTLRIIFIFFLSGLIAFSAYPLPPKAVPEINYKANVRKIVDGDFSKIEPDWAKKRLFISGFEQPTLLEYDLNQESINKIPALKTGYAQYHKINQKKREIYLYNKEIKKLVVFDLDTFSIKRMSLPVPMAVGDNFIEYDNKNEFIFIESEMNKDKGYKFAALNMNTLKVEKTLDINGYLLMNPDREELYAYSYFWLRNPCFYVLDTDKLEIVKRKKITMPILEYVVSNKYKKIYCSSPFVRKIIILDIVNLSKIGVIKIPFGMRILTIDKKRNLLFAGGFLDGKVHMIDIRTKKTLKRYNVGFWLRDFCLDSKKRILYIVGKYGLYQINY
jgi:hypothetical protein